MNLDPNIVFREESSGEDYSETESELVACDKYPQTTRSQKPTKQHATKKTPIQNEETSIVFSETSQDSINQQGLEKSQTFPFTTSS